MEYAFDSFEHTPANFRALRDMVGFKQDEFADIVGADRSEVRRWDSGKAPIPEVAWRALQGLVDDHFAAVHDVVTLAGKVSDPESEPVRDQSSLSVVFIQPIGNFLLSFSVM